MSHGTQAESLQVAHAVRFLGTIWGQPLKELFKASSVVCVPSRYEPFGIAVLEVTRLVHVCGMTRSCVRHDSFKCGLCVTSFL